MKCVVLVLALGVLGCASAQNKVLVDWILSLQMKQMGAALAAAGKTSVPLGDWEFGDVVAKGVKLGDLSSLDKREHSYLWIPEDNTMEALAYVGLNNMTISVDSLTVAGKTFPAVFVADVNSLSFRQKVTFQESTCQEVYSDILITNLDRVTIYSSEPEFNDKDVSQYAKVRVVPVINQKMQQQEFLDLVQKYLDMCSKLKGVK